MNLLTIAGNVGQEPRHNVVGTGENAVSVLNFSVAVNERRRGEDVTTWVDCALWGKRADALQPYITKGSKVTVSGPASAELYTPNNGDPQAKLKLRVQDITLQGGGQQNSQPAQEQQSSGGGATGGDEFSDTIPFGPINGRVN